jgi:hypothetical protein
LTVSASNRPLAACDVNGVAIPLFSHATPTFIGIIFGQRDGELERVPDNARVIAVVSYPVHPTRPPQWQAVISMVANLMVPA